MIGWVGGKSLDDVLRGGSYLPTYMVRYMT
jgi:hypothetical protein